MSLITISLRILWKFYSCCTFAGQQTSQPWGGLREWNSSPARLDPPPGCPDYPPTVSFPILSLLRVNNPQRLSYIEMDEIGQIYVPFLLNL